MSFPVYLWQEKSPWITLARGLLKGRNETSEKIHNTHKNIFIIALKNSQLHNVVYT
jgi:hypothetical protein